MLKRPLISEKTLRLAKEGLYTFEIFAQITKPQIAKMIKEKFNVDVLAVKTVNVKPKKKLQRNRRGFYQTRGLKKAIVIVKPGQKIALFEDITQEEVRVEKAEDEVKEKKSLLKGTKVRVEKIGKEKLAEDNERAKEQNKEQETVQLKKRTQGRKKGDS